MQLNKVKGRCPPRPTRSRCKTRHCMELSSNYLHMGFLRPLTTPLAPVRRSQRDHCIELWGFHIKAGGQRPRPSRPPSPCSGSTIAWRSHEIFIEWWAPPPNTSPWTLCRINFAWSVQADYSGEGASSPTPYPPLVRHVVEPLTSCGKGGWGASRPTDNPLPPLQGAPLHGVVNLLYQSMGAAPPHTTPRPLFGDCHCTALYGNYPKLRGLHSATQPCHMCNELHVMDLLCDGVEVGVSAHPPPTHTHPWPLLGSTMAYSWYATHKGWGALPIQTFLAHVQEAPLHDCHTIIWDGGGGVLCPPTTPLAPVRTRRPALHGVNMQLLKVKGFCYPGPTMP